MDIMGEVEKTRKHTNSNIMAGARIRECKRRRMMGLFITADTQSKQVQLCLVQSNRYSRPPNRQQRTLSYRVYLKSPEIPYLNVGHRLHDSKKELLLDWAAAGPRASPASGAAGVQSFFSESSRNSP